MGYYVQLVDSDVVLKAENQAEILQRWKDLNKQENNHLKRGGSYSGGKQTSWHYSWMPADYDQTVNSAEEVLELLGFDFDTNEVGDIIISSYDSKTGNEDIFFQAIANLVSEGSTMSWHGEDGASFCWYFNGKEMQELDTKTAMKAAIKALTQKVPEVKVAKSSRFKDIL